MSCRNDVKEISANFKDLAEVGLAVLKKIVIFEDSKMTVQTCLGLQAKKIGFLFPK